MSIQKCDDNVSFVPIGLGVDILADKIAQHGFSDLWIGFVRKGVSQHRWSGRHIEQA